jgi:N utilization substance protein A
LASIHQSIEILSKEKGIDPQVILDAVKDALLAAARKHYGPNEELIADLDERTGAIQIYSVKNVVESVSNPDTEMTLEQARKLDKGAEIGGQVRIPKNMESLGRISAQTAKQVIMQKVREAERENVYSEFSGRVGELVTCTVKRIDNQELIVDLGKTEARMPKKEQSKLENFSLGDRIRCVIKSVEKTGKNAGVIVSRAASDFVVRLFEQEVPEIYDGTVTIKGCAREAGERTKIAVWSRDRDVDSVGACVGMKGMRVQSIIRELRGEKIDIIEYSEDIVTYATHALSPAKISRVTILDPNEKQMEVIVDDSQLSLAIGKKGQNVRLAAKLLGWRIDIKSEEEKRQEVESAMASLVVPGAPVTALIEQGLPEEIVAKLSEAGVDTVEKLGSMTPEELEAIPGIDQELIPSLQAAVIAHYAQYETVAETAETGPALGSEAGAGADAEAGAEAEGDLASPAQEIQANDQTDQAFEAAPPQTVTGERPEEDRPGEAPGRDASTTKGYELKAPETGESDTIKDSN